MFYEAELLRPGRQLLKIILGPFVVAYAFVLWVFLSGQVGKHKFKTPLAVELGVSWVWITVLIIFLVVIVKFLIRLIFSSSSDFQNVISIKQDNIEVHQADKVLKFSISRAEKIKYKSSWIWTRIFLQRFYRAGILKIRYEGNRYVFFFQVANNGKEDDLKKQFSRLEL